MHMDSIAVAAQYHVDKEYAPSAEGRVRFICGFYQGALWGESFPWISLRDIMPPTESLSDDTYRSLTRGFLWATRGGS